MTLERPQLFTTRRDILLFGSLCLVIFSLSLLQRYETFRHLKQFDDAVIDVTVLKQYLKHREGRSYYVLKLRGDYGTFYTSASPHIRHLLGRTLRLKVWVNRYSFYDQLSGGYLPSKIIKVYRHLNAKTILAHAIAAQHESPLIGELYGALFTALPMSQSLQKQLSTLGISHLLAISGFHLGLISALLYWLLRPLYRLCQERYFPYRSAHRDLFVLVFVVISAYLYFLGLLPSLLRAYTMLLIGFILFDRGMEVLSMQTLFLTVMLLLALMPTLLLSLGFWLSVAGVFYIFVYLIYFQHSKTHYNLIGVAIWVYLMMLPVSLYIFENFSLYHPFSVVASILFLPFYTLTSVLHVFSQGALFDEYLLHYLQWGNHPRILTLPYYIIIAHLILSLLALRYRYAAIALLPWSLLIFAGAIHHIT
ncbi:MAG: ComEC/Rec2 family competence protein [Sulfurimonas sp.]|nr:MAG: ComEC/Rec2 family competence protein [Sulfurimonas sp.]